MSQSQSQSGLLKPLAFLIGCGLVGFVGVGLWKASTPVTPPLQGQAEARTIEVAPRIPGRIQAVLVKEGDNVQAGSVLARIEIPELTAKLGQVTAQREAADAKARLVDEGARQEQIAAAKAQFERAKSGHALALKTYERVSALYKDGLVSAQKYDEANANLSNAANLAKAAQSQYDMALNGARQDEKLAARSIAEKARQGVEEVMSLASEAQLKAPVAGEVSRVVLHAGEVTPAGFPIVTLIDHSDKWVTFNIREDELPGITVGSEMTARIPALAQDKVKLSVYWISPRADYATWRSTRQSSGYDIRTFEVRARPVTPLRDLRPGMSVLVDRAK